MQDQKIFVLAEKPDAARKIASALSADGHISYEKNGVLELTSGFDGRHYVICSAVGHLYELIDPLALRNVFPGTGHRVAPKVLETKSQVQNLGLFGSGFNNQEED